MKQVFIVYDSAVGSFTNQLKAEWTKAGWELLGMLPIHADEQHKTLDTLESICRALLSAGASRSTLLLAVGGGVTTDICGFAAAVFKRGMAVEYVPTTLLAQVDAAIGGKTGVNLDGLKNCLGVIRLPQKIHFRSEPLRTLPAA
ncbi:MAG: 3-dehydroquinate synthase, partial [Bacteroidales bacterium]|nr:3-dehydroquinate synthase [Bacteroidales bacterium]